VQINAATKFTRPIKRVDNSNPEGGGIMGLGNVLGNPLGGAARGGAKGGHQQKVTTGQQNTTIWNGIHHKTNLSGSPSLLLSLPAPLSFFSGVHVCTGNKAMLCVTKYISTGLHVKSEVDTFPAIG
jgi:hypothetical protein